MDHIRCDKKGDGARCLVGEKVLCRARPMPVRPEFTENAKHLRVLTYNIFVRPFVASHDGQRERTNHIPRALAGLPGAPADVLVFQEAFDDGKLGSHLRSELTRAGWPHHTDLVRGNTVLGLSNGGVFIASRWPIEATAQHVFQDACTGSDCLAAKGVIYAKIRKRFDGAEAVYHVLGTHLQSGDDSEPAAVRSRQMTQIANFLRRLNIPADEAVILAGDFNVDALQDADEMTSMLQSLDADLPTREHLNHPTSDPTTNALVGQSGDAESGGCKDQYLAAEQCPCCRGQHLDYILVARAHRRPVRASGEVIRLKAETPFRVCMSAPLQPHFVYGTSRFCRLSWDISDMSDHYPVRMTLDFSGSSSSIATFPKIQDGPLSEF